MADPKGAEEAGYGHPKDPEADGEGGGVGEGGGGEGAAGEGEGGGKGDGDEETRVVIKISKEDIRREIVMLEMKREEEAASGTFEGDWKRHNDDV